MIMAEEPQCPYCLICQGKIPANIIYEDPSFTAALEIKPANAGHVVLFPKSHSKTVSDLSAKELEHLSQAISKISSVLQKLSSGVNVLISEGEAAGQVFNHLTINIIPRFENDNLVFAWQPKPVTEEQTSQLKKVLSDSLKAMIKKPEEPKLPEADLEKIKSKIEASLEKLKKRRP